MMSSSSTGGMNPVAYYQIICLAGQVWNLGLMHSTLCTLFRYDNDSNLDMDVLLSTSLYFYSILWSLIWLRENNEILCFTTGIGLFVAFLSITKTAATSQYRQYSMSLVAFLIISTLIVCLLFIHGPEIFFFAMSELACSLLVLSPSLGYQLSLKFASFPYYVCAVGFSAFWVIETILAVAEHENWWPLLLSTMTLALSLRQFRFYMRARTPVSSPNLFVVHQGLNGGSFLLRELRFNQSANSLPVSAQVTLGERRDSEFSYQTVSDSEGYDTDLSVTENGNRRESYNAAGTTTIALSPIHYPNIYAKPMASESSDFQQLLSQSPYSDLEDSHLDFPLSRFSILSAKSSSSLLVQSQAVGLNGRDSLGSHQQLSDSRRGSWKPNSRRRHGRENSLDSFYSYGSCFDDEDSIDSNEEDAQFCQKSGEAFVLPKKKRSKKSRRKVTNDVSIIESV